MENQSLINYKIYSPSYKRSRTAVSHNLFYKDSFCYVVRQEEVSSYRKNLDANIIGIPTGQDKSIATARNWILDNTPEKYIVMVDDDLTQIIWTLKRKYQKLSKDEIHTMIVNGFNNCIDANTKLWGLNVTLDQMAYVLNRPFSFSSPVLGPFSGIIKSDLLRYDESLPVKEDYDYFIQCMMHYRRVLRFNMFFYSCDHQKKAGGCQEYRTEELEKEQAALLQKKWGSDIVKENFYTKNSINMRVDVGL